MSGITAAMLSPAMEMGPLDAGTLIFACGHVVRDERPILLVVHHSDDSWQMACGDHDHPEDMADAASIHLSHLTERQPNIAQATGIAPGYLVEWSDGRWLTTAHDD